ncbi:MAG: Abi family protein [Microthrixaceae bacterium]
MTVDEASAEQWLRSVGYYRLSGYWYVYQEPDPGGSSRHRDTFQAGTDFDAVAAMCEFDRKLRSVMLDGWERVEVALRNGLNEELEVLGPLTYMNPVHFRSSFDHAKWLVTAKRRVVRASRSSTSVQHYQRRY